jgi:hypothetical protein
MLPPNIFAALKDLRIRAPCLVPGMLSSRELRVLEEAQEAISLLLQGCKRAVDEGGDLPAKAARTETSKVRDGRGLKTRLSAGNTKRCRSLL